MPYHRIPKKPEGLRKSWIKATGRQCHGKNKFIVTLYTRVCGAHFVNGVKSDNLHSVDYIHTQKLPVTITTPGQPTQPRLTATSTKARVYLEAVETSLKAKHIRYNVRRKLVINEVDINDVQHEVQIKTENLSQSEPKIPDISSANIIQFPIHQEDHMYAKAVFPNMSKDPPMQSVSIQTNKDELSCCLFTAIPVQDKSTQMPECRPSHNAKIILASSKKVQFYTGLPNNETFHALFEYLKPKAQRLVYWKGKQTKTGKRKGEQKMSLLDQFFGTLVRLRLGLAIKDIAERFNVSVGYMSSVFNTWARFFRLELEALFPYPSAEQVKQNLPESFSKFPNTRLIIDCTEIYVQKPNVLKAQRQTWLNYKHRNTREILIGITPGGTVAYVSPLYGGSASDKLIVKHCGLLHHIQ
ncbi:hypothetical protein MAR_001891 [Mya arenaria]|uniref:Transposase n=1 Tax=Mya arenaria TaxID=6604 RepID=A0ABY7FD13_MYAAR|nr:hypothetical protein MAR_001891 [Mya arenaria]